MKTSVLEYALASPAPCWVSEVIRPCYMSSDAFTQKMFPLVYTFLELLGAHGARAFTVVSAFSCIGKINIMILWNIRKFWNYDCTQRFAPPALLLISLVSRVPLWATTHRCFVAMHLLWWKWEIISLHFLVSWWFSVKSSINLDFLGPFGGWTSIENRIEFVKG